MVIFFPTKENVNSSYDILGEMLSIQFHILKGDKVDEDAKINVCFYGYFLQMISM